MAMLNEWLHHGNVQDPHQEFLIKEQKSIRREGLEQDYTDEYWEKRYTLRQDLVPPQLDSIKDRVLLAGKYLNVVRECGGIENVTRDLDTSTDVPHTFEDPRFLENVSGAYAFANRSLMTLLLTTHALPARLRSLKHYFFLDRSDFFSYFLELTHSELRKKPAKNVNVGKLQSLLDIVLRQPGSVAAEDPFKEDVKVVMNDVGLTGWLMRVVNVQGMDADATSLTSYTPAAGHSTNSDGREEKDISGYEALTLDYAVPFPLSLVVSRVTLTRYQLLFRYLLSLKHLETLLTNSWAEHTKGRAWHHKSGNKTAVSRKIENWKRRAWCLRSRMLCFVQQLLYFCTSEVIEPNWQGFMARLAQPEGEAMETDSPKVERTVDELMQDHVDFLATCLKECMLTNSKLLRVSL
jgi:gamma-tubulin complex component 2